MASDQQLVGLLAADSARGRMLVIQVEVCPPELVPVLAVEASSRDVEGLHLDEEALVWAQGGQVEPWAVDNKRPLGVLLLDLEEPLRDEVVPLGDVQAAQGELP